MNKSIAKALAAFLCIPVLAMSGVTAKAAEPKTPFTIAVFQSEGYLPDFVAKEKGFGEKYGLDISFVTPSSGSAAAQLLLAGAINGWSTDPLIIATAASRGYDIRIGGVSAPSFTYTIMTIPGKQWPDPSAPLLERIKALKGKRIGVSGIGAGTDNALLLFLKEAGLTAQDVTRVAIGQQQAAIGQLSAGRIDAFVSFALAGNEMIKEETGAVEYISTLTEDVPASIRNTPHLAFAVSSEFANKNPKAVQGWLNAERDAIAWMRENQEEAAAILDKHIFNGKQPELARKIVPMALQSFFRNTRDDLKIPESAFDLVVQEGRVVGSFKDSQEPTYEQVVLPFARMKD